MADYTSLTDWSYKFANHPHCEPFDVVLNNIYSEDFDNAVVDRIFTDANKTLFATNIIPVLRAAIIDIIMISSTADRAVVATIINQMLLFEFFGNPGRKYPIRSTATVTKALNVSVATNRTDIVLQLNPVQVFVGPYNFAVMNFTGISLTGPIRHINIAGASTDPATYATVTALTPAQVAAAAVTATAANQALVAQQQAAAAALAATLPTKFDSNNLPPEVKTRYENHLNPSHLMTKSDMQPYPTPTGGVCPVLSYLDPPMGTGVSC